LEATTKDFEWKLENNRLLKTSNFFWWQI